MINPYAFIRVHNEIATIKTCMESIQPVIKKGVIGYHLPLDNQQDDGTIRYLENFCKQNPGYQLIQYPHKVYPANHPIYKNIDQVPVEERLDSFYNAILAHIPQNEWLIKIDADQIYHTAILSVLLQKNFDKNLVVWFGRYNLHYDFYTKKLFNINNPFISREKDHWLIYNNNLHFTFDSGYLNKKFYAWELLDVNQLNPSFKLVEYPIFSWHFPDLKLSRHQASKNYKLSSYQAIEHPCLPEIMTNEKLILNICQTFINPSA